MLIITRSVEDTLMINHDVAITVLGIKGSQVRMGIKAPKNISVHRQEIYLRIQEGQKAKDESAIEENKKER